MAAQAQATAAETTTAIQKVRRILDHPKYKEQLAIALAGTQFAPDFMVRAAMTMVQADDKLLSADPISLAASLVQLAQAGLVPDGFGGQAYLIPFWNKDKKAYVATPLIGWRGYVNLGYQSDKVTKFDAQLVREGDVFDCDIAAGTVTHKQCLDAKKRGKVIAVYAIVRFSSGEQIVELMLPEDIETIRLSSKSKDSPAWTNSWDEMARKTVVRRIAKRVPVPRLQRAASMEEADEAGAVRTTLSETGEIIFGQTPTAEEPSPPRRAEEVSQERPASQQEENTSQEKPEGGLFEKDKKPAAEAPKPSLSKGNRSKLFAAARQVWGKKDSEDKLHEFLAKTYNVKSVNDLTDEKFEAVLEAVEAQGKLS